MNDFCWYVAGGRKHRARLIRKDGSFCVIEIDGLGSERSVIRVSKNKIYDTEKAADKALERYGYPSRTDPDPSALPEYNTSAPKKEIPYYPASDWRAWTWHHPGN